MAKISVIGSGSWGTANAIMLSENGHDVTLWSYLKEECEDLLKYKENRPFLPGVPIPASVNHTSDIHSCVDADIIVCAVPSFAVPNAEITCGFR